MNNIIKVKELAKEKLHQLDQLEATRVEELNVYERAQYDFFLNVSLLEDEAALEYLQSMKKGLNKSQKTLGATTFIAYKNALAQCEEIMGNIETSDIDEAEIHTPEVSKWLVIALGILFLIGVIMMCTGCGDKEPIQKHERYMSINGRKMDLVDKGWGVYEGKYDSLPISFSFYSSTNVYYTIEYKDTFIDGLVIVPTTRPLNGTFYSDRKDTFFFNNYNW